MSKGLRSYPENQRMAVAMRRTQNPKEKGNGYWAAVDYLAKVKKVKTPKMETK